MRDWRDPPEPRNELQEIRKEVETIRARLTRLIDLAVNQQSVLSRIEKSAEAIREIVVTFTPWIVAMVLLILLAVVFF